MTTETSLAKETEMSYQLTYKDQPEAGSIQLGKPTLTLFLAAMVELGMVQPEATRPPDPTDVPWWMTPSMIADALATLEGADLHADGLSANTLFAVRRIEWKELTSFMSRAFTRGGVIIR